MKKLLLSFLLISSFAAFIFPQEGGYVNKFSITKGDTVKFYISTSKDPFTLSIFKVEEEDNFITEFDSVDGGIQVVPDSSYWYGCNWNYNLSFVIPDSWEPGAYHAVFPTTDGEAGIIFFVTENQPGSFSNIVFVSSTNTWNAYNYFGGKSSYGFNSTDSVGSNKVSFLRPNWYSYGSLDFYRYEREVISWMARENFYPEFTTDTDLHFNSEILKNYDVAIIAGHSEYWTNEHRWQFQKFLDAGGKIIILAGASCWSQVRMEDDKMVKYRPSTDDPLYGVVDSLVTSIFNKPPVDWPENELTGVSGEHGGYINHNGRYDHSEGFGDYAAYNTHHWIFEGTGLTEGEEYGYEEEIVGNENDGAVFEWQDGIPVVTGVNNTPLNFRILSMSPAYHYMQQLNIQGWATMGMFYHPNGGAVFNSSTIRWAWGLDSNKVVQRITKNILDKFLNENFPPDIISWSPAVIDSAVINTKMHYLNTRDFLYKTDSLNTDFSIEIEDPNNENVNYIWTENGNIISREPGVEINSTSLYEEGKKHSIKVYAYNSKDTSSLTWNYFNSELVISTDPVIWVEPGGDYFYPLNVFNHHNDDLSFELTEAPAWIELDEENNLTGTSPAVEDSFQISIKVTNEHSQTDVQNFTLFVSNTVVKIDEILTPNEFSLAQNYPNPFNPTTSIQYAVGSKQFVSLIVYDVLGNEIAIIVNEEKSAGEYEIEFSAASFNLSSGIYFYQLKAGDFFQTNKMILMK